MCTCVVLINSVLQYCSLDISGQKTSQTAEMKRKKSNYILGCGGKPSRNLLVKDNCVDDDARKHLLVNTANYWKLKRGFCHGKKNHFQ